MDSLDEMELFRLGVKVKFFLELAQGTGQRVITSGEVATARNVPIASPAIFISGTTLEEQTALGIDDPDIDCAVPVAVTVDEMAGFGLTGFMARGI